MICSSKIKWVFTVFSLPVLFCSFRQSALLHQAPVQVKLSFINYVKENKIVLNDSTYTNPFKETYKITKLRYYITNIVLQKDPDEFTERNSYHLIDESKAASQVINLSIPPGDYNSVRFLLGVDSLRNVSGAQTDDLDPAKDMFWTWNTGYVMAKMEGNSPDSKMVNNKFEFHVGGFSGAYNVLKQLHLPFAKTTRFEPGKSYEIVIVADINSWWQMPNDIKIAEHPVITTPGKFAKEISDNYANMFSLNKIISE